MSFQIFPYDGNIKDLDFIKEEINLETTKYFIKVRMLGLRDLKSSGLMSVKRAWMKFDLNSLYMINFKIKRRFIAG